MDEIYVLTIDEVFDGNEHFDLEVFDSIDTANTRLLEVKDDYIISENWVVYDYTNEEDDTLFSYEAYEDGDERNNHIYLTIWQREIE